jgi:monoamine oxidase
LALERLVDRGDHVELHLRDGREGDRPVVVAARHAVLALPPRVAEATVAFEPRLHPDLI